MELIHSLLKAKNLKEILEKRENWAINQKRKVHQVPDELSNKQAILYKNMLALEGGDLIKSNKIYSW